jgi:hypothetical protein
VHFFHTILVNFIITLPKFSNFLRDFMAHCFQGFGNQESIMEKVIYEYIYICAFDDPFETILCIYFYIYFLNDINNQL